MKFNKKVVSLGAALVLVSCLGVVSAFATDNYADGLTMAGVNDKASEANSEVVSSSDGRVCVTGDLPNAAEVEVLVPEGAVENTLMEEMILPTDDSFSHVDFYDISVVEEGERMQPEGAVEVVLESAGVESGEKVDVYHVLDDADAVSRAIEQDVAKSFVVKDAEALEALSPAVEAAKLYASEDNEVFYTVLSSEKGEVSVNEDGAIVFNTDSFSIYAVSGYNNESGADLIGNDSTINMKRGEVRYFKWEKPDGVTLEAQSRGTWTVEAGDEYVDFEVYNSNLSADDSTGDNTNFYQYYWLKLTAKEVSGAEKATIQFEYVVKGNDGDGDAYVRQQEIFYVQVIETDDALYIDDQIAENGCLVPVLRDSSMSTEGVEYSWTRSDGEPVDVEALASPYAVSDGAVNVAMDRGGIDAEDVGKPGAAKTYTVTAMRGTETLGTAEYTVPYGNELLNGSFEYPKSVYVTHDYPNGAPSLYWKTTSESVRDNEICQDIEILNADKDFLQSSGTYAIESIYGISKLVAGKTFNNQKLTYDDVEPDHIFPDGVQCAEINCDAPGALYQDILTYPGTEMYWSLSHRGRNYSGSTASSGGTWLPDGFSYTVTANGKTTTLTDQKDYMYVIAAPADQVEHIKTQNQLNELIGAAGYPVDDFTVQKPTTQYSFDANGKEVTYNGISYKIWEVATDHTAWKEYASSAAYEVGDGEYLTRFFFAAGSNSQDRWRVAMGYDANYSAGNFIDKVSFSDEMPWTIEYYKNGVIQESLTETGVVDLDRATMRYQLNKVASNTDSPVLDDTTLVKTEINGRAYSGTTLDWVYSGHNVLQLYYEDFGVTVTKRVSISNYDQLSDAEKAAFASKMENYTVPFSLYEQGGDDPVATALAKIDSETLFGSATFVDSKGNKFLPEKSKAYIIKEGTLPYVEGLALTLKAADSGLLMGGLVYAYTATNVYELRADLTIAKDGISSVDNHAAGVGAEEGQSTLFNVAKADGTFVGTVAVHGNNSVTIKDLPLGDYIVTEEESWSWRYTPTSVIDKDKDVEAEVVPSGGWMVKVDFDGNEVSFTNTRDIDKWLSGDNWCRNLFDGKNEVIQGTKDE